MKQKIIILGVALLLVAALVLPAAVLASHEAQQEAATEMATTIAIKAQDGTTDVTKITFPEDAPSATVKAPYNDHDTDASPQTFSDSASKPVVTLISAVNYKVIVEIADTLGWADLVTREGFFLTDSTVVTEAIFDTGKFNITVWDTEIDTTFTVTETVKNLYLDITLTALAGKTGESTISILGES